MGNKFLRMILLMLPVYAPLIILSGIFGPIGLLIGFFVSFLICMLIILNQDRIILRIFKAYPVLSGNFKEIEEKVVKLSVHAGVPRPLIHVTNLPLQGSFIIGKDQNRTALVIPLRLLSFLNENEFEAMLAYNIVQINNNLRLRTLAALMSTILTMPASIIRWCAVFTGFGDYDDPAPKLLGLIVMGLVAPPASVIVQSFTDGDYDAEAAVLCRNSKALISAIERLENNNVRAYPSVGSLSLIDPQRENFFEYLFYSHPPKELRFNKLIKSE